MNFESGKMFGHRFFINFNKYRFLLLELVKKNMKVKYKDSVLGIFWSFLNPLLTMIVLTIVFSAIFKNSIPNFPVYILTGRLIFDLFSTATKGAMNSVKSNSGIIKKIYVPKYIYGLGAICSEIVNFFISLIVLVLVMLATGAPFSIYNITFIIPFIFLVILIIGVGFFLASLNVFFTDIKYLYGVFTMLLMYSSAIFYPISIIPKNFLFFFKLNPVYSAISCFRDAILLGQFPNIHSLTYLAIVSIVIFFIGVFTFYKLQDKFILHI